MTETIQGRRVPDGTEPHKYEPGDYGVVLIGAGRHRPVWYCHPPVGGIRGNLEGHEVEEHEDGTITVSPSILISTRVGGEDRELWHGFLERGVWRSA